MATTVANVSRNFFAALLQLLLLTLHRLQFAKKFLEGMLIGGGAYASTVDEATFWWSHISQKSFIIGFVNSRARELKEVIAEILERGDIKQYWERKMEEERNRGLEVDMDYRSTATTTLEQDKAIQESASAESIKQKATLECHEQLLSSLKAEVIERSERLSLEKANYIDELHDIRQHDLHDIRQHDLQAKYEGLFDAISILEAEIEALRILIYWIEDEARKGQARAKVLQILESYT